MLSGIITIDPEIMTGVACIRDTRIPVSIILKLLAQKETFESIISDYPELNEADILACLEYAAWRVSEKEVPVNS